MIGHPRCSEWNWQQRNILQGTLANIINRLTLASTAALGRERERDRERERERGRERDGEREREGGRGARGLLSLD